MAKRVLKGASTDVAGLMLENVDHEWSGIELMTELGYASGTIYAMLGRMTSDGWLTKRDLGTAGIYKATRYVYKPTQLGIKEMGRLLR